MKITATRGISLDRFFGCSEKKLRLSFNELLDEFSEILRQHVKKSHIRRLAQKKSTKDYFYTLDFWANRQRQSTQYNQLALITSFGFVLCASRLNPLSIPVAIVGFEIENDYLVIKQLNDTCIEESQEALRPLKWERLLCQLVALFAHSLNLKKVSICSIDSQYKTARDSGSIEKLNGISTMDKNLRLYFRYCKIFQKKEPEWDQRSQMFTYQISS